VSRNAVPRGLDPHRRDRRATGRGPSRPVLPGSAAHGRRREHTVASGRRRARGAPPATHGRIRCGRGASGAAADDHDIDPPPRDPPASAARRVIGGRHTTSAPRIGTAAIAIGVEWRLELADRPEVRAGEQGPEPCGCRRAAGTSARRGAYRLRVIRVSRTRAPT
jgi:hypothetical protein